MSKNLIEQLIENNIKIKKLLEELTSVKGAGIYALKCHDEILYIGSSQEMGDARTRHNSNLKYNRYLNTNKDKIQQLYNKGENIEFIVLHRSAHNEELKSMNKEQKKSLQKALSVLEQLFINLYKDTIVNKQSTVKRHSSNRNENTTRLRRLKNLGSQNPNIKYDEESIKEILWLKENGFSVKRIKELLEEREIMMSESYIYKIGKLRWKHIKGKKPSWI